MWIFNKSKKLFLADIIPDGFIDIHSHILPGIDDGATTVEQSVQLLCELSELNISAFIATPHNIQGVWENSPEKVNQSLQALQKQDNLPIDATKIRASSEYMLDNRFRELLKTNKVVALKDRYLLVEMSYIAAPINLYELLFELQDQGYKPILAHPERYSFLHGNMAEYKRLKQVGCKFQLNLASITGYYGQGPNRAADELLQAKLYDFVGTDVHHSRHIKALKSNILLKKTDELQQIINANLFFQI
ncbi:tyrosine-protein phosphatase [Flavobacterium aurantiibacter]|uniref:protein-tyrosine-phosphatase n=1 Tax=Flavobacterium aurantiibacter TaxID=2023067 RepID=A0A255ZST4_9FLAO|nr:CpsB/CapC family capsule biosynthesis tyrosine phosphatase [Flavobacterium aurantiibacter]OYQ43935.1 hypothetical protein CHX27_08170 [Flavobacterium aurantiibacter]